MIKKSPQVSIILATYNRAHFIGETLDSIQNQSFANWECLIIDDGSEDNTIEILKPYLEKDNRFNYIKRNSKYKKGLPSCRNIGLDLVTGDFIIFFDDDDIVHPQLLETCVSFLRTNFVDFCAYNKMPFSETWDKEFHKINTDLKTRKIGLNNLEEVLTGKLGLASCTVMWKKICFNSIRFNEELMYAEEWECYSRILINGHSGLYIDEILYFNRKHLKSNTGEYFTNNPVRKSSKAKAIKLVTSNLKQHKLLTDSLIKFFIQTSFFIKNYNLLSYILKESNSNILKVWGYKVIYRFYPIFKPAFKLKSKIIKP